ncbi:MAG: biotin--[acetyl-CoA-carboxylase] ligase [Candidatus Microthrix parvicella]
MSGPDVPDPAGFGGIRWVERCDSTNTLVRAMVADLPATAAPRVVAIADEQTAGRGRLDRRWEARPGSALMLSVAHEAPGRPELLSALPLAMGLAALEAIGEVTGVEPRLKWPNDVVVDAPGQRWLKLGGILGESFDDPRGPAAAASSVTTSSATSSGTTGRVAVLGIGINTGWESPRSDLPEATSLNLLIGRTVDRRALAHELLVRYQRWWRRLLVGDGAAFQAALHERSATLGQRVRVELPTSVLVGTAKSITAGGALVVNDDQGVRNEVTVGDVVHLRAAEGG